MPDHTEDYTEADSDDDHEFASLCYKLGCPRYAVEDGLCEAHATSVGKYIL